jgi:UDP-N-acetyl-D-mannosaminuronate dehydrogenase
MFNTISMIGLGYIGLSLVRGSDKEEIDDPIWDIPKQMHGQQNSDCLGNPQRNN